MTFFSRQHLIKGIYTLQNFNVDSLQKPLWWLFAAGIFSSFAFEPFGLDVLALAPGLWLLLALMEGASLKKCFKVGWIFGFGHFLSGLYWISISLTVDFKSFFWLFPFALGAIPAILAILSGISALLARLTGRTGWPMALAFCFFWCALEWMRGHVLTGFPWNLVGYSLISSIKVMQIAHIIGVYGLSLLVLVMAVLTFHRVGVWITGLMWGLLWIYGYFHMENPTFVEGIYLRLVQPSIAQDLKWKPQQREITLNTLKTLSQSPSTSPVTHIIWPESAATFDVIYDANAVQTVAAYLKPTQHLIFGAPHIKRTAFGKIEIIWNSIFALKNHAELIHIYDKTHLVPFGEYVPFREILASFINKVTPGTLDYSKGLGITTTHLGSIPPFSPLICYEVIFPSQVADFKKDRPLWLLNVTNDGWFGTSTGPYQHLAMAQTRAIETGLPLIRVANNGVSVITDGHGRIIKKLGLNTQGVIDSPLPHALKIPLYSLYGDVFFFAMMVGLACTIAAGIVYRRRKFYA